MRETAGQVIKIGNKHPYQLSSHLCSIITWGNATSVSDLLAVSDVLMSIHLTSCLSLFQGLKKL